MTRKIVVVLMAFLCLYQTTIFAQQKDPKVNIHLANTTVKEVFRQMQQQTGKYFGYQSKDLEGLPRLQFDCTNKSLEDALQQLLEGTGLTFDIRGNNVIVKKIPGNTPAKQVESAGNNDAAIGNRTLKGRVVTTSQEAVPGVSVLGLQSNKTAFANDNGEFAITVPDNETMLIFSSIGFESSKVMLGASRVLNVVMQERVGSLKQVEVVSTGYVNLPKERATGSFGVVTAKDLEKIPVPNVIHRLEGQVAGVQLNIGESDNSFVYGNLTGSVQGNGSYDIIVRGATTLNTGVNKKPLLVIDGFPSEMDIRTINPADVAQITFLKDAAAASIWGARASAGVIVITTKKGKLNDGAPKISFSAGAGFNGKPRINALPMMNASQMIDYEQELVSKGFITDPSLLPGYNQRPVSTVVDWIFKTKRGEVTQAQQDSMFNILRGRDSRSQVQDYLLRAASTQHYDLNINGGTTNHTYFISGAYDKENTSSKGTGGERMTLSVNQDFKFFKNITFSANLRGSWFRFTQNALGIGVYARSATPLMPYDQLVDDNGNSVSYARAYYSGRLSSLEAKGYLPWGYNYIDELNDADNTVTESNYAANLGLNIPITNGLSLNGQYMVERANSSVRTYYSEDTYFTRNLVNSATSIGNDGKLVYGIPTGAILNTNDVTKNNYSIRGQLNFDRNFLGKHQINALAGSEIRQTIDGSNTNRLYGYNPQSQYHKPVDYVKPYTSVDGYSYNISNGQGYSNQRRRFLSYFGNLAYTYDGKYTLSGSARYDDYNNFGLDKKYRARPFWSSGVSWAVSKEKFLQDAGWLNSLTLRTTYGINGNISLSALPYDQISLVASDYRYPYDPYAIILFPSNPALRWEETAVYNAGIDFSMLNNRLSGSLEYYFKKGKDLFATFPIDNTVGFDNITRNTATLNGKGVDIAINGVIMKKKDFEWSGRFLFSYNTNKVTDARYNITSSLLQSGGVGGPIEGYPSDYVFAFRYAGLDKNGSPRVLSAKGDTLGIYQQLGSVDDLKYMGRLAPPFFGSLTQTFRYKGLTLFVMATYKMGNVFFRPVPSEYPGRYGLVNYETSSLIADRWRKPGDEAFTNVPGLQGNSGTAQARYTNADFNILPGDHIRLREVSLTYDVPVKIFQRLPIRGISISGAARNLGMIWVKNDLGIDPDFPPATRNLKLPPSASYNFSLNVNF